MNLAKRYHEHLFKTIKKVSKTIIILIITIIITSNLFAKQLEPNDTEALVKITVSDFNNKVRVNDIVILKAIKTNKEYKSITDYKGYAELLVPKGDKYLISYIVLGMDEKYDTLNIPDKPGLATLTLTIMYEPAKTITLENVYFDFNKSTLKPASFKSLNELADFMKIKTSLVIEIAGHTDNIGDDNFNKTLSQARAESVRNYLIKKGVSAERLVAKGYGEAEPIADNESETERQKNRRTEIRIVKE